MISCKSGDDFLSASRNVEVVGRRLGQGQKDLQRVF